MSDRKWDTAAAASRELKRTLKARKGQKFMMRERLAKRDLDYAESGHAAKVTVEERGGRVIETRGRCGIAPRITNMWSC